MFELSNTFFANFNLKCVVGFFFSFSENSLPSEKLTFLNKLKNKENYANCELIINVFLVCLNSVLRSNFMRFVFCTHH